MMKKYRSERKGRRSLDMALEYGTVRAMATEEPQTADPAVCATRLVEEVQGIKDYGVPFDPSNLK